VWERERQREGESEGEKKRGMEGGREGVAVCMCELVFINSYMHACIGIYVEKFSCVCKSVRKHRAGYIFWKYRGYKERELVTHTYFG